jgi:hypothetical protein
MTDNPFDRHGFGLDVSHQTQAAELQTQLGHSGLKLPLHQVWRLAHEARVSTAHMINVLGLRPKLLAWQWGPPQALTQAWVQRVCQTHQAHMALLERAKWKLPATGGSDYSHHQKRFEAACQLLPIALQESPDLSWAQELMLAIEGSAREMLGRLDVKKSGSDQQMRGQIQNKFKLAREGFAFEVQNRSGLNKQAEYALNGWLKGTKFNIQVVDAILPADHKLLMYNSLEKRIIFNDILDYARKDASQAVNSIYSTDPSTESIARFSSLQKYIQFLYLHENRVLRILDEGVNARDFFDHELQGKSGNVFQQKTLNVLNKLINPLTKAAVIKLVVPKIETDLNAAWNSPKKKNSKVIFLESIDFLAHSKDVNDLLQAAPGILQSSLGVLRFKAGVLDFVVGLYKDIQTTSPESIDFRSTLNQAEVKLQQANLDLTHKFDELRAAVGDESVAVTLIKQASEHFEWLQLKINALKKR